MPTYRVLVIEDSIDDEALTLRALGRCDLQIDVKVVRDGEQALESLDLLDPGREADPPHFDLVLCDLKLPKFQGDEVAARAKVSDRWKDVAIVMFSSSDEPSDVRRCLALGANAYYVKPVDPAKYMECVRLAARLFLIGEDTRLEGACRPVAYYAGPGHTGTNA